MPPAPPRSDPAGPGRHGPDRQQGLGGRTYIAVGVVVAVVIAVVLAAFLLTHKSSNTNAPTNPATGNLPGQNPFPSTESGGTTASQRPTTGTSGQATAKGKATGSAKASGKSTKGSGTKSGAFVLSSPDTAGGYPKVAANEIVGRAGEPIEQQVVAAVKTNGGGSGTVAAGGDYQLPTFSQVMAFTGYTGTFDPSKIETILGSLGSDQNIYPAGANGGTFGCVNTTPSANSASDGVCVWATKTTLGIVEFFSSTGPETLSSSQEKGAADALKLREGVETKKS